MWHWFHKDAASLSTGTCLSHSIFKLELKFGFVVLWALHSPSSQRMESDLVYPISLGNFSAVPPLPPYHSSPEWMLSRFQPIHTVCSDLIHFKWWGQVWSRKLFMTPYTWNRICQFIWISSKGITYVRVKRSHFKMAPQRGLKKTNL